MIVLVLNCGSSTVKFQIVETDLEMIEEDRDRRLAQGAVERIGGHAVATFESRGRRPSKRDAPIRDHRSAIGMILEWIASDDSRIDGIRSLADIPAVGHRVVHGAEQFKSSVRIDEDVLQGIEDCIELAPLHNPANLRGIRAVSEILGPDVPQVAVFDTAFHTTMPEASYLYGLPYHLYRRHKIRRYGFHGTSHRYVAYRYRRLRNLSRKDVNIITLHLGNGCSACAIRGGDSVDTSMGFTPLEGLLMGTRCGDLDPALVEYLSHKEGLSLGEIDTMLNKQSGLLGISGITGDMRDLLEEVAENRDRRAALAIEIFCRRVRKYVGAYFVTAPETEAVVFAGGIGENAPSIRTRICEGLESIGLELDEERNASIETGGTGRITRDGSPLEGWVIPTDEELLIARDTFRVISGTPMRY